MLARKLILTTAVLAATSAHAQFDSMMNPMGMMMPMTMMMAPMSMGMMGGMGGSMMNPMGMMMPMTMMMAPMSMGMMGGMGGGMMNPMSMMSPMGGFGSTPQMMGNPYLNPMAATNPYLMQQQPQGFFPMMPAAPAPAYNMPAPSFFPPMMAAPQK